MARRVAEDISDVKSIAPDGATHYQWSQATQRFRASEETYFPIGDKAHSPDFSSVKLQEVTLRFYRKEGDGWEVVPCDWKSYLCTGYAEPQKTEEKIVASNQSQSSGLTESERREFKDNEVQARRAGYDLESLKQRDVLLLRERELVNQLYMERIEDLKAQRDNLQKQVDEAPQGLTLYDVLIHPNGHRAIENIVLALKSASSVAASYAGAKAGSKKSKIKDAIATLSPGERQEVLALLEAKKEDKQ